ncbi:MAG: TauD/TfdA family dioxygenase [Proteobacteria bacterium]|nr:TauD/TfdA family dioxygenase [Pseudomonadota bacterium]
MRQLELRPHPGAGVEILGVDLAQPSDEELKFIQNAYAEHGLVFFRDQSLTEQSQIELAGKFGPINVNRFFAAHPDYPEIALVVKEPDQLTAIGEGWHTDHSYDQDPAMGSILVAKELPSSGGDTWFVSMYDAFNRLSEGLKQTLRGLKAVHSARHIFGTGQGYTQTADVAGQRIGNPAAADELIDPVHPVVIRHPLSGKEVLYVNPAFTRHFEGWTREESLPLLEYLYQQAVEEDHVCRFRWEPGSVAFWDNRATWHAAQNDYQGMRREMHRITIDGCPLEAAGSL